MIGNDVETNSCDSQNRPTNSALLTERQQHTVRHSVDLRTNGACSCSASAAQGVRLREANLWRNFETLDIYKYIYKYTQTLRHTYIQTYIGPADRAGQKRQKINYWPRRRLSDIRLKRRVVPFTTAHWWDITWSSCSATSWPHSQVQKPIIRLSTSHTDKSKIATKICTHSPLLCHHSSSNQKLVPSTLTLVIPSPFPLVVRTCSFSTKSSCSNVFLSPSRNNSTWLQMKKWFLVEGLCLPLTGWTAPRKSRQCHTPPVLSCLLSHVDLEAVLLSTVLLPDLIASQSSSNHSILFVASGIEAI